MELCVAFLTALVFGVGLVVSGMTDPTKVIGFLDPAGRWDPSLAFVMAGAILTSFFAFRLSNHHNVSLIGAKMRLSTAGKIDRRLIWGSFLFGVGWGLAGFCPGPALVSLGRLQGKALIFVLAMLAGMHLYEVLNARRAGR
ncbi:MAG TPA: DUF6691 family protein [Gammaproteobacteria bacterium]|nr:DUF6691 family protein [Gammaproteobacteria bacterium]